MGARGAPGCRSRQGPLPLLDLGPALFEDGTIGVQTLDKYRVILEESCQTGLQDRHRDDSGTAFCTW